MTTLLWCVVGWYTLIYVLLRYVPAARHVLFVEPMYREGLNNNDSPEKKNRKYRTALFNAWWLSPAFLFVGIALLLGLVVMETGAWVGRLLFWGVRH